MGVPQWREGDVCFNIGLLLSFAAIHELYQSGLIHCVGWHRPTSESGQVPTWASGTCTEDLRRDCIRAHCNWLFRSVRALHRSANLLACLIDRAKRCRHRPSSTLALNCNVPQISKGKWLRQGHARSPMPWQSVAAAAAGAAGGAGRQRWWVFTRPSCILPNRALYVGGVPRV